MAEPNFDGLLFIGDPHLASRNIGFRKDDFGKTILGKLTWCLTYADSNNLMPVILGDVFHHPRDNANWLLGELVELLVRYPVVGIYGNHDCYEDTLGENDSLDVLTSAGSYRMLTLENPWRGSVCGQSVAVYGRSWRLPIPDLINRSATDQYVILVTHHDFNFSVEDTKAYLKLREIPGVDLVVNGHLHRRREPQVRGATQWVNPGNITRAARGDASQSAEPQVLKVAFVDGQWDFKGIVVPHEPFDSVFFEAVIGEHEVSTRSEFVRGLAELQARRTESGAGLREFLELNLGTYELGTQSEIRRLADLVLADQSAGTQQGEI